MVLVKNEKLINNLYKLEVKSVGEQQILPSFVDFYGTPSKISLNIIPKKKASGIEYKNSIKLIYPGLKTEDFLNFHKLLHDNFLIKIYFSDGNIYHLGTEDVPLNLNYSYSDKRGFSLSFSNTTFVLPQSSSLISTSNFMGVYEDGVYELNTYQ